MPQRREIKALSETEVSGYLDGRGMGFAKAGELNGYPGPAHLLELADKLRLTSEQTTENISESVYLDLIFASRKLPYSLANRPSHETPPANRCLAILLLQKRSAFHE
jgi:hypothetical protein